MSKHFTLVTWFWPKGRAFILAENYQSLRHFSPLLYEEGDSWERLDKAREYMELRETAKKECKEAHSVMPGHTVLLWKCRHDQSAHSLAPGHEFTRVYGVRSLISNISGSTEISGHGRAPILGKIELWYY
jgi:hypothetical protein